MEGLTTEYLKDFDFILDYSSIARNIEHVRNYYGFKNYGVFRNGYTGYNVPRLRLKDRHYIVPSYQNKRVFEKHGFTDADVSVCYYGIPDFYRPDELSEEEFYKFIPENILSFGGYFLYPHRPTPEKGSYHILELAKTFPEEIFVFMVSNNPVTQHKEATIDLRRRTVAMGLNNVKFVELPLTNKHHYFKRELMRHAKAILSPFNPSVYLEGFGLANAEAVACGTPLLITDSESSRELWIDEKDGLIIPYDDRLWGFKQAIKHFNSYTFEPVNKFSVKESINSYLNFINQTIEKNQNE